MKKVVLGIALMALAMFIGCASGPRLTPEQQAQQRAWEYDNPQYSSAADFDWNIRGGGVRITGYTGRLANVRIPPQMYGMPVVEIGERAFSGRGITRVTIPDSVTRIGRWAFSGTRLTSVTLGNGVTTIERGAFAGSIDGHGNPLGQLTSVNIPNSVTYIGMNAFAANQLTGNIVVSAGTHVGGGAFGNARVVSDAAAARTPPQQVGGVAASPQQVEQLAAQLAAQQAWEQADAPYNHENDFQFVRSTDLNSVIITRYVGTSQEVRIPSHIRQLPVTTIGFRAFSGRNLLRVTIPDTVTAIHGEAFVNNQLISVVIPNSVITIGDSAFSGNRLSSVTISNSVTAISYGTFSRNQLTSITIPNSVTTIAPRAFANNQLVSLTIPDSVTTIGRGLPAAFVGTIFFTDGAFQDNHLVNVTIPNSVTSIGIGSFQNNRLTSVIIPDSVTSISQDAFRNNQLTSVTISNGLTRIVGGVFANNNLTSVTIPASVTHIDGGGGGALDAFGGNQLSNITIGANVNVFYGLPNGFIAVYHRSNRRAGTYTLSNGIWVEEW